ncbi:MAG: hypothetical protein KF708_07385 [Pirellulales bacterium]|nr:hypothetical protein [Pirellulales bacterium]
MESIIRDVTTLDESQRRLVEALLGHQLEDNQRLYIEDVLRRPRVQRSLQLDNDEVVEFVVAVREAAEEIQLPATIPPYVPDDPKDAALVQTSIVGRVDVLCTRDRHLLHPQVLAICQANGIRILSDIELLNELRAVEPGKPTA